MVDISKQAVDIQLRILEQRIESVEKQIQFLNSNWVSWTSRTKEIGSQIVAALADKIEETKE